MMGLTNMLEEQLFTKRRYNVEISTSRIQTEGGNTQLMHVLVDCSTTGGTEECSNTRTGINDCY